MRNWLLPEHIADLLPDEAARVEHLRRVLIDHFVAQRYRLVQPPMIEHIDSLATGSGRDLELQTFRMVDPLSGRMLGLRADITPQIARIDAHLLNESGVTRLCYAGSVLRSRAPATGSAREVIQVGAELFGEPGIAGDQEVIALILSALSAAGVANLHLDLGHVGVYRALANGAGIGNNGDDSEMFAALRVKDAPAVDALTQRLPAAWRDALRALPQLYGPSDEVLARAEGRGIAHRPVRLAWLSLPQQRDVLGVHRRRIRRDRQWRPLRWHRPCVRARAAGDRIHARPAPDRRRRRA